MSFFLLNRTTSVLTAWPRGDNEMVVGLDRNTYHVVEVIQEPQPTEFDPTTHQVQPVAPVISITDPDSQGANGTVTYGWEVVALPPPAIPPGWAAFRQAILTENGYVDAHALALKSDNNLIKFAATALFDTLRAFENTGNYTEYLQALLLTVSNPALPLSEQTELAEEFIGLAQRCHLPEAFITAFQQAIIPPGNSE